MILQSILLLQNLTRRRSRHALCRCRSIGELCRWEVKWTEHEMPTGISAPPDSPLRRIAIVFQFRYPPIGREHFYSGLRFCLRGRLRSPGAKARRKLQTKSRFVCTTRVITLHPVELRLRTRFDSAKFARTASLISISVIFTRMYVSTRANFSNAVKRNRVLNWKLICEINKNSSNLRKFGNPIFNFINFNTRK